MNETSPTQEKRRKTRLLLVLFAVLLLTVGLAWALVKAKQQPLENGARLADRLGAEGLSAHWPDRDVSWYVIEEDGHPIGMSVRGLWRRDDGGYDGLEVLQRTNTVSAAVWTLAPKADRGTYLGRSLQVHPRFGQVESKAFVRLGDQRVRILQGGEVSSAARAPANYAPEGTLDLLIALAGRADRNAQFQVTLDSVPPWGTMPRFFPIYARPADGAENGQVTVRVERKFGRSSQADLHTYDANNVLARLKSGRVVQRRISRKEALDALPGGLELLTQQVKLLRRTRGQEVPVQSWGRMLGDLFGPAETRPNVPAPTSLPPGAI